MQENGLAKETADQVRAVRAGVGAWLREDMTFLRFAGPDAGSWLQTQTSNDVAKLKTGQGQLNAHLDRKGHPYAAFTIHRWEDEYWSFVDKAAAPALLESLDAHLFIEEVEMADSGDEVEQVVLQGPRTVAFLASLMDTEDGIASELLPTEMYGVHPIELLGYEVLAFRITLTGEDGYVLVTEKDQGRPLLDSILESQHQITCREIGEEAREILRVEGGVPKFGVDYDATNRLPETTLEREAVSYDKGCYVGQEVIAKLKTYGAVKRALMGLILSQDEGLPAHNTDLYFEGKKIGTTKSPVWSPTLQRPIVMAYLDRDYRAPNSDLAFHLGKEGPQLVGTVKVLPFVEAPTREERAQKLYDEALQKFESDLEDEDDTAIQLLKEAVLLHPTFEDAYESLGVILNRHGRVDEAIYYMKILERLNPDCLMAHTNLSVFYVAKGMIEEAEEEKAKASVLQMKQASDTRKAEEIAKAERERLKQEALERIEMFTEVLEIDPDDPLATFGLGQSYMQLNEYDNAVPHLERATQVQKDYSAAYLNLGKCHEFLGQTDAAIEAYRIGIEAANRKGDFMPLREMERRMKALEEGVGVE